MCLHAYILNQKTNLHHTRSITPMRVTSSEVHLRGLASGQHSFNEISQRWRAAGDTVLDLTSLGTKPQTSHTNNDIFHNCTNRVS